MGAPHIVPTPDLATVGDEHLLLRPSSEKDVRSQGTWVLEPSPWLVYSFYKHFLSPSLVPALHKDTGMPQE